MFWFAKHHIAFMKVAFFNEKFPYNVTWKCENALSQKSQNITKKKWMHIQHPFKLILSKGKPLAPKIHSTHLAHPF